jgi:very-short-patch-repair endonuclease
MKKRVIERNMFYGAGKNIFIKAFKLRNNMTDAEKALWEVLKKRDIFNVRFKRQHPIDIFIVDFYCHNYKLAIEVDGDIHLEKEIIDYDDGRTHDIEQYGVTILRFTNREVFENIDKVKDCILNEIDKLKST